MVSEKILILLPIKECSKRLPGKNFRLLNGKRLWQYSYEVAKAFWKNHICDIYISSESRHMRYNIPEEQFLLRPSELARDPYEIVDVCLYVLNNQLQDKGLFMRRRIFIKIPGYDIGEIPQEQMDPICAGVMDVFIDRGQGMPEIKQIAMDCLELTQDFMPLFQYEKNPGVILPGKRG
jgi:hypothetical protein